MYQNTPSELKFLMVDPKQVELELYSGLPYLLAPIVFESEKALKLLKWCVDEMERRYSLLKEKRVKNIDEYNHKIIGEKMYRIVFVVDELADMMMS
jgi:S-DNA-T family DNA segregation ATPase FtsK/SpoIIIE